MPTILPSTIPTFQHDITNIAPLGSPEERYSSQMPSQKTANETFPNQLLASLTASTRTTKRRIRTNSCISITSHHHPRRHSRAPIIINDRTRSSLAPLHTHRRRSPIIKDLVISHAHNTRGVETIIRKREPRHEVGTARCREHPFDHHVSAVGVVVYPLGCVADYREIRPEGKGCGLDVRIGELRGELGVREGECAVYEGQESICTRIDNVG